MRNLHNKIGEMEFDGLITDVVPDIQVRGGTIAAPDEAVTYKRGTVLAKSTASGKLYMLGSTASDGDTLTPDCILCDNTDMETSDAPVTVYTAGCFDETKVSVAEGYIITETDMDNLRKRGIVFKSATPAN